ncbi:PREDICTED: protein CBFA2T3 [Wasmannia auropunctata]|uniref:protein CBFA2T3 n=1 Tax=Wasmannia auropunctata TaxID=64793 RepID=UPI0005ED80EC|nr:PREDICTED: protein CBFA2T3 [Wasmannia auropunctata]
MKVEGGVATTTVLHKVKVKEETKECCGGYQQASPSSATSTATTATVATLTVSAATAITTTVTNNSNGVSTVNANPSTTTTVVVAAPAASAATPAPQSSSIICHPPTTVSNTVDSFPVDLDLKAKSKGSSATREKSSREDAVQPEAHSPSSQQHQRIGQQKQTNGPRSEYKGTSGCSRSSDNDSPLPSQSLKPELEEAAANAGPRTTDEQGDGAALANGGATGASRCVSGIFAGHGKLKRLLGTLVQFATDISADTGDTVRTLVLALLSGSMTAEEFHSALQEATNFPLRSFVLPYLKHTLPSLQRDLSNAARANNQSCVQFLRSNESAVLEAVGLVPSGESVEVFGEHGGANGIGGGNQCSAHYAMRSNSNPGAIQHAVGSNAAGALHHYPGVAHAPKRRASDTPYYENGVLLDDMPVYGKRSVNPWSHHHQQQQQQQQQQPTDPSYCWYHPLHTSGGSIQGHAHGHGHGPSPVPPSLVQINQINAFSAPHHLTQQPQPSMGHGLQTQNGGSLDDEWKNIHVMLNCILGMVEKTKRALAILQRRGCSSPAAAAAPPPGVVAAQNGTSNNGNSNGNNPSSTNGVQVESSTGDRDGSLKRLSGEIVAQTIRATEDRVAEVKRRAEEAVLEVKRAAVAEVQRAVAVAVAESRANERLRVHRLLDLPLSQRNPGSLRQGPFLRVHGNSTAVETSARNVTTPTTTPNSAPSTTEDEKDIHLTSMMGSSCWNCGRPALETCGGCGIARYCGSFCQHRDWEAGHHTTCNNLPPREPRRSASRSPPRVTAANLSTSVNEVDATPVPSAGVSSKGK